MKIRFIFCNDKAEANSEVECFRLKSAYFWMILCQKAPKTSILGVLEQKFSEKTHFTFKSQFRNFVVFDFARCEIGF